LDRSPPNRAASALLVTRPALGAFFLAVFTAASAVSAADVTKPSEVRNLRADRSGADVILAWDPVTTDAAGGAETVDHYNVYRGGEPGFEPDRAGGSNRAGSPVGTSFADSGAATDGLDHYYLVTAVDASGNESAAEPSTVTTPPILSGFWTETTIETSWTDAAPPSEVAGYRVYYGKASGRYEFVDDVGLVTSHSLSGLQTGVFWYVAVTAVDVHGNESAFSNEIVEAVAGRGRIRAHDDDELCWGAAKCPPDPGEVQRNDGWQLMVPVDFPPGDWTKVTVTYTIDSRLCEPPAQGTTNKCGEDPAQGGYNPCGDPWDRIALLFLVLDDCIERGVSCVTPSNLELMHAITPFGTDAPPPDGSGRVPPRVLTLDITPFAPLLLGRRYVGVEIAHYVQAGWHVTVDFDFSERADEASPKKPADGFAPLVFEGGGSILVPRQVTIPAEAQQVMARFFVSGHGGNPACDGGANDGQPCATSGECPGGTCQNCDEFCHRTHYVKVDGRNAWVTTPWRDDCSPGSLFACQDWNACGWPSCTFSRAGWCPGYIACDHDPPCDQDHDLTLDLTPGATHDVTWEIPVRNGDWFKSMVVYWYRQCHGACGNGRRECSELCDGGDLDGETCKSQGFDAGTLACNGSCSGFDTSGCRFYACGNSICEPRAGEDCLSCPADCNGVQGGSPSSRYCCGDGDGQKPVGCSDPRCTANGKSCDPT